MNALGENLGRLARAVATDTEDHLTITLRHHKSGVEVLIPGYIIRSTCVASSDRTAAPCRISLEHRGESNFSADIKFAAVFRPTVQEDLMAELAKQTSLMTATDLGHLLRIVRNLGA